MVEYPAVQWLLDERTLENAHDFLLRLLRNRFRELDAVVVAEVEATKELKKLEELFDVAVTIPTLQEFRACLTKATPPPPESTRKRRKKS